MRPVISVIIFFIILVVLISVHKSISGFKGEGIGGGGSGSAYQEIGFQDLNEAELIYQNQKTKEAFRGGGGFSGAGIGHGEAITGGTGGSGSAYQSDLEEEGFADLNISGKPETSDVSGPADASLNNPRKPYNLLEQLPPAPRGSISCLKASCCAETDFEWRTNLTGNYLQRTNNYKREFPDNCTGPLHELTLAFYKPELLSKV